MSAESIPISSERFAKALQDLSLSSLYLKVAELRNSIAHLEKSNSELEEYVRQEEDKDCYEAILENREVIKRMEERIALIKKEVTEIRCLPWQPEDGGTTVEASSRGDGDVEMSGAAQQNGAGVENGNAPTQDGNSESQEEEGIFL